MSETITFSILEKDGNQAINAAELARRYKVYCREVSQIDLEQKGGFAIPGAMLHCHYRLGSNFITTEASGKNPVVISIDKRDTNASDPKTALVLGRAGILLMNEVGISKGNINGNAQLLYDEINVQVKYPTKKSYAPIAYYIPQGRTVVASGFESALAGLDVYNNPYFTIAHDLDHLEKERVFRFDALPVAAVPNIDKSLKPKDSIHGSMWMPQNRKFMGEIGGIVLTQDLLNPYGQPEFLAEPLISQFENIPGNKLDELLSLIIDQKGRFLGMQAQFQMLQDMLEAKIKAKGYDDVCPDCGHLVSDHNIGGFPQLCNQPGCSCVSKRGGQAGNTNPFARLP